MISAGLIAAGAVQTDPYTFTNGTVASATEVNLRFTRLYTLQNGNIDAANVDLTDDYTWTGVHTFDGGMVWKRGAYAAGATTGVTEIVIGVTDTTAARAIDIPSALIAAGTYVIVVKDEYGTAGLNHITVSGEGAETINGVASIDIVEDYGSMRLYSDGTNLFTW